MKKFLLGQSVRKVKGYAYYGRVVAAFQTTKGDDRYVVESTSEGSLGMLFIFNDGQLEPWLKSPEGDAEGVDHRGAS